MSSFGSNDLFGAGASGNAASTSYAPPMGLRQRPNANAGAGAGIDENANPNNATRDIPTYGKFGSMSKVPAPPRMSLATAGKSSFQANRRSAAPATQQQQQASTSQNDSRNAQSHQQSMAQREEDLSLWVVASGYRNEAHFRALYSRLESCGTITARRGGLSCFGEGKVDNDTSADSGNNWVAVRYDSALCAQKALCQDRHFISVGGSTMVVGVMPLNESDAAVKLGINVHESSPRDEAVRLPRSYNNNRNNGELKTEADIMLFGGEQGDGISDNEVKSGLDSLCGKVLAWFFMWDNTQA